MRDEKLHNAAGIAMPQLQWSASLEVQIGVPQEVGATLGGWRRVIPITGGQAQGDGWTARVLPGGADFQLLVSDQLAQLDARYVLEADGGDLIYVTNYALRGGSKEAMQRIRNGEWVDPTTMYFRCTPRFETASPQFAWLQERLFVGSGARYPDCVAMQFFQVL